MSEDPLRDLRWAQRARRRSNRSFAGTLTKLGLVVLAVAVGARLLIRSGVSYGWLLLLREIEMRLVLVGVGSLVMAVLTWFNSRERSLFYRPTIAGTGLLILLLAAILIATLTFLAFHFL